MHITAGDSSGSGFGVDANGYLITNAHVIEHCEHPRVKLRKDHEVEAEIAGVDLNTGLAVLHVEADDLSEAERQQIKEQTIELGDCTRAQLAIPAPPRTGANTDSSALHHLKRRGAVEAVRRGVWRLAR